jgi:hypothetical protein
MVNTGEAPAGVLERYMRGGQYPVEVDHENLEGRGFHLVEGNVISTNSLARHDAVKEAELLMDILISILSPSSLVSEEERDPS